MTVAVAVFSGFFPVGDLHAQGNATFSVSSVTAAAGDIAPVTVSVIHDAPATAYSFTLVCDPASASLGNVQLSAEVLAAQGSTPFVVISEFATLPGFQCSVIFDIIALPTLSANVTHDICHADLTVAAGAAPGVSALDLTSDVTEPPLQPVQILASGVGGTEMLSVGVDGILEVIAASTATLAVVTPVAPVAVGDGVDARIEISGSATIDACSFGLAHDPAVLDLPLGGVVVGADLAVVRGGLGPEFLAIEILPAGFTFAMAVQASGVGLGLAAGGPREIAVASYTVLPTAPYGSTALVPTDALGTPPVVRSIVMGTNAVEPPPSTAGSVFVARPFSRGDVNGNDVVTISDAIAMLTVLFSGGTVPCLDAADANVDDAFDLADPISVLDYLFEDGAAIPAPFGACGLPALPPTLSCDAPTCP